MDFIINNQQVMVSIFSIVVVWLVGRVFKKQADKAQIAAALTMILDIIQDIANSADTRDLDNEQKKKIAVARIEAKLPDKKKTLVAKTFGTLGGAVEFVYKNRKWLFSAAGKLVKAVF